MNFGQIPCTIVQGLQPNFRVTLKIFKKSNFDWNQLKVSTQHKDMYMHLKNYKNEEFSPSHFWQNLADDPVL